MMTPEREKQIRKYYAPENQYISELLAELDRVRAERDEYERLAKSWMSDYDKLKDKYEPMELELSGLQEHQHVYNKNRKDLLAGNEQLREKLEIAINALAFYAAKTNESEWDGGKFLIFDKFGCLDADMSGPFVANETLAKIKGVK